MQDESLLQAAIDKVSVETYRTSKTDVIEYYKDQHGESGWRSAIARDLVGIVKNKKGEDVSYRNIRRRFEGTRAESAKATKGGQDYKALGEKLPSLGRTPKGNSITIIITGTQVADRKAKTTRDRRITATFTGTDAYQFVNNPNYRDIWLGYAEGNEDIADLLEDGEYAIDVGGVSAA